MADQTKTKSIEEKIQEALEKLGDSLGEWLTGARPQPKPIPVPIDRRPQFRRR